MITKNIFSVLGLFLLTINWAAVAVAQCPFDPTVTGDLLVCPESSTTLSTQQYDSYQWYRRSFPNGVAEPIAGATQASLEVDFQETPVYIFVEATATGCTEQSPEVLVDGLAFLPVTVLSSGDFEIGNNGEQIICAGDTIFQILNLPYTLNIQWYDGANPIPGANDDTLVVTQPGNYWVTASPTECPDITASLGLQISVVWGSSPGCTTGIGEPGAPEFDVLLMPNPAYQSVWIAVDVFEPVRLKLFDQLGRQVHEQEFSVSTEINTGNLPAGIYSLFLQSENGRATRQLVVSR